MSILYNTSYGLFPLARYLFPFSDATHKPNIAFPGLPVRVAPLPLTQIQARAALTLFEELDRDPTNPKMDWAQESLDILTRYEKLKTNPLHAAVGDLNLADENLEVPLTLEEEIAKKWYRLEPMEQFDYRDSLVEFIDQLSSSPSLPSSNSLNPDSNQNSATNTINSTASLNPTSGAPKPISRFLCKPWERSMYAHKSILRTTWEALEHSGEAREWVRGVGDGEDPEKEWVDLMERVIKRGLEMDGDKREVN